MQLDYTRDAAGQVTAITGIEEPTTVSGTETIAIDPNSNRMTIAGANNLTHDASGNLTSDGVRTFTWDALNRLVKVEQNGTVVATYGYDSQNRRIRKTVGSQTILFCYDLNNQLIAETTADGTVLREYISLDGEPLAVREYQGTAGLYYYANDHLGTPQQLIKSDGTVVWKAAYLPYGQSQVRTETVVNNLRFPGQYFDAETGLHYNWHRFYDPETGRYLSADPIGLDGGMNLYAYVQNNPVNRVDPEGLAIAVPIIPPPPVAGTPGNQKPPPIPDPIDWLKDHYNPDSTLGKAFEYWFADNSESYINKDGTVKDKPTTCDDIGKWMCEGYGQYDQIGTPKHVRRGSNWHVAYGPSETLARDAWINQVQSAAPSGFTARHIKPRCKKVR